jgi:hypothetical protein
LKPWGGMRGKKVPKGYYNCNADKHSKTFACGFTPWSKLIDTPIIIESKKTLEECLAALLWELTFYGWSETRCDANVKEIKKHIDESVKEIKEGKCVKIPKSSPEGYDVVIPDSVSQMFIDITNGKKSKKKTK